MIRPIALATAIAVSLLAVSGAGGAPAQTPKRGGTVVFRMIGIRACLSQRPARELQPRPRRPELGREGSAEAFEVGPDFTSRKASSRRSTSL